MSFRFYLMLYALCCLPLSGCSTLQYYSESIAGQWELFSSQEDISHLIQREDTPSKLREKLQLAIEIREFAFQHLGLPDNGSYRTYADLGRPYVVWNVFATEELSLDPYLSCFPFVGCLSYRGFFSPDSAKAFSTDLSSQGMDTYIGGVAAYSTLGWFRDPLLNTMFHWSDTRLAEVIFHELAHQKLYIPDDSDFNEAFATTIGIHGVKTWLATTSNLGKIAKYQLDQQRHVEFTDLILNAREQLDILYSSADSRHRKRAQKTVIYSTLLNDYYALRTQWGGYSGYDKWMETDLNNAKLLSVSTYQSLVAGFQRLLTGCGYELNCFYSIVAYLGDLTSEERRQCLLNKHIEVVAGSTARGCQPGQTEMQNT